MLFCALQLKKDKLQLFEYFVSVLFKWNQELHPGLVRFILSYSFRNFSFWHQQWMPQLIITEC